MSTASAAATKAAESFCLCESVGTNKFAESTSQERRKCTHVLVYFLQNEKKTVESDFVLFCFLWGFQRFCVSSSFFDFLTRNKIIRFHFRLSLFAERTLLKKNSQNTETHTNVYTQMIQKLSSNV